MAGDVSTAVLVAATDETEDGQAHNLFKTGDQQAIYAIGRFGKQFNDGNHSFNVMQTGVFRDESTWDGPTRNGYVSGADFELQFKDRMYQVTGSFVGQHGRRAARRQRRLDGRSLAEPTARARRFEVKKARR